MSSLTRSLWLHTTCPPMAPHGGWRSVWVLGGLHTPPLWLQPQNSKKPLSCSNRPDHCNTMSKATNGTDPVPLLLLSNLSISRRAGWSIWLITGVVPFPERCDLAAQTCSVAVQTNVLVVQTDELSCIDAVTQITHLWPEGKRLHTEIPLLSREIKSCIIRGHHIEHWLISHFITCLGQTNKWLERKPIIAVVIFTDFIFYISLFKCSIIRNYQNIYKIKNANIIIIRKCSIFDQVWSPGWLVPLHTSPYLVTKMWSIICILVTRHLRETHCEVCLCPVFSVFYFQAEWAEFKNISVL